MTEEASKIIEDAKIQAEQTRIIAANEAGLIIQNALAQADEIKRNLVPAGELKQANN